MTGTQRSTVVGVFETREQAERAVEELRRLGFSDDALALVVHHPKRGVVEVTDLDAAEAARVSGESKAGEGTVAGAVTGGILGGLMALPALIPGVGPVLSFGTLAAALFGVAAGAAGGGIVGALIGEDFPEPEARFYERELKAGRVLVGVRAGERFAEAVEALRRAGAYDASTPARR
jgi:hypothetical protein